MQLLAPINVRSNTRGMQPPIGMFGALHSRSYSNQMGQSQVQHHLSPAANHMLLLQASGALNYDLQVEVQRELQRRQSLLHHQMQPQLMNSQHEYPLPHGMTNLMHLGMGVTVPAPVSNNHTSVAYMMDQTRSTQRTDNMYFQQHIQHRTVPGVNIALLLEEHVHDTRLMALQPNPATGGQPTHVISNGEHLNLDDTTRSNRVASLSLPISLSLADDQLVLSPHQCLLRMHIEAFEADENDISTHTRGRNKPISLGQVGIRCRHCAHVPVNQRKKGSTYYPAILMGMYQAGQNMSTAHMQSGICSEMDERSKLQLAEIGTTKVMSSAGGRTYWAYTATRLGLVDTPLGIRFVQGFRQ
jgi:hypothetical protein